MSDEKKAALVFIERADGGVLSVWNRNYHVWGLPGGKVEPGEQVIDAALRELGEETGIFIGYSGLTLVDVSPTYSGSGRTCHTFRHSRDAPHYPVSVEIGGGVGWMTRDFLANQGGDALRAAVGEWFQIFFGRIGK